MPAAELAEKRPVERRNMWPGWILSVHNGIVPCLGRQPRYAVADSRPVNASAPEMTL